MPQSLPEIGSKIDLPTAIKTTYKIVKEHSAVEERVLRYYVDLSRVVSTDEASEIVRTLIEDEKSHHEMLSRLSSDLKDLYGEQLALDSED